MSQTAKVMFVVPEDAAGLVLILEDLGGECEDCKDNLAAFLAGQSGQMTSFVFSDSDDPVDDAKAITDELKIHGSPYFAVTDSFVEKSRGDRYQATVALNITGAADGERMERFPWERGEPDVNEESLEIVGFSVEDIKAMTDKFFPESPPRRQFGL
jgi:hypothetical protein